MIETLVRTWLEQQLAVPVYLEVPAHPPAVFVVVQKTGTGCANLICSATMAVQSYAESLYEAARLNVRVKAALDRLPEREEICAARLNSDYPFTDTTSKRHRYQAVYDITHYQIVSQPDTGEEITHG